MSAFRKPSRGPMPHDRCYAEGGYVDEFGPMEASSADNGPPVRRSTRGDISSVRDAHTYDYTNTPSVQAPAPVRVREVTIRPENEYTPAPEPVRTVSVPTPRPRPQPRQQQAAPAPVYKAPPRQAARDTNQDIAVQRWYDKHSTGD